ncbi:MAG TPA: hypothetical protein VFA43_24720 [Gemmatimonadaceae bacterium]|nr:hypothetical protein [Gemmatimonadaceae bacterium]
MLDEALGLYRVVARAYALGGSDADKRQTLKRLASTDFHIAEEFPDVLAPYMTTVVEDPKAEP